MDEKTLEALKECLDKTPNDAVKYLKSLGIEISWEWKEQLEIIKRHSFTVAKVMNADILQDILDELIKAADEGKTFKEFKEDLQEVLVLAGYVHDKGSSWRLDTIYRTNMQTAYMAGRFEQMKSVVEAFPYWQYIAVMDIRTRPHHAAMHGKVFKADDPIWQSWYPPNGFRCFPGDTLIATVDGWTRIDKLKVGHRVVGGSGEERLVRFVHHNRFNGRFVRITIEEGFALLTTPNHRVLTLRGWITARNLTTADVIVNISKVPPRDILITDVNKLDAKISYLTMPLPTDTPLASLRETLDAEIEFVNENINPIRRNRVIVDSVKFQFMGNVIDHYRLVLGRLSFEINMLVRILEIYSFSRFAHFKPNLMSSCRRSFFKFKRFLKLLRAKILSSTKPGVKPFGVPFANNFAEPLACVGFPRVSINPLRFDSFTATPRLDSEVIKQFENSMIAHAPTLNQLPSGEFLNDVEVEEGFTSGAPLDSFDSLDSFVVYARSHLSLSKIVDISFTNTQNNTDIYNLDVEFDESYVTQIGIVHNCRCRITALDDSTLERKNLSVSDGKDVKIKPDEGFERAPGFVDYVPDTKKYADPIREKLADILEKNMKIKVKKE